MEELRFVREAAGEDRDAILSENPRRLFDLGRLSGGPRGFGAVSPVRPSKKEARRVDRGHRERRAG